MAQILYEAIDTKEKPYALYALERQGRAHETWGAPMQDSSAAVTLPNGWAVLVAADGVGSCPKADVGSRLATESVVKYLADRVGTMKDASALPELLRAAYEHACRAIRARAVRDGEEARAYGTTLHTAVFTGSGLYFGHVGDGGILALTAKGEYRSLTTPMKGDDGQSVIPLMAGPEHWVFGQAEEELQSVLLCTDGVYDTLCPPVLRRLNGGMERALAGYFLSPYAFDWRGTEIENNLSEMAACFAAPDPAAFCPRLVSMLAQGGEAGPAERFLLREMWPDRLSPMYLEQIQDDITAVGLIRTDRLPQARPMADYTPPDWREINRAIDSALYGARRSPDPVPPIRAGRRLLPKNWRSGLRQMAKRIKYWRM
ncbi:MAG: protein phosphatase 2C domain-containing protein [Clostridia bacterium]|nr:protein phosphatase 2C domain-containing protein [Clostridia bacterium]